MAYLLVTHLRGYAHFSPTWHRPIFRERYSLCVESSAMDQSRLAPTPAVAFPRTMAIVGLTPRDGVLPQRNPPLVGISPILPCWMASQHSADPSVVRSWN